MLLFTWYCLQPQPAKKVGLSLGNTPGGNELAVDGLAVQQEHVNTLNLATHNRKSS